MTPSRGIATIPLSSSAVAAAVRTGFDEALTRTEPVERDVLIAGQLARLRFAGPALVDDFMPALAHLLTTGRDRESPALTVGLWDAASTGVDPIPLPPGAVHAGESGVRYHAEEGDLVLHIADATVSVVDVAAGTAWQYVPDAHGLLWHQRAAPLKDVVHAWAGRHGLLVVHAAAVGRRAGGVLIAGTAGSGKSTTSLACLRAGFAFAGDDYVLVDTARPWVHSLYSSAKLEWDHLRRHPDLFHAANAPPDAKALSFLAHDATEQLVAGFDLRAVILPRVSDRDETRAVATTPSQALLRLAPSTILQTPGRSPAALGALAALVQRVPAFRLDLGRSLDTIPEALDAVITEVGGR